MLTDAAMGQNPPPRFASAHVRCLGCENALPGLESVSSNIRTSVCPRSQRLAQFLA
jgi:hypothetical protein